MMSRFQALRDLVGMGQQPYTATLNPFLHIDVDALARDMDLEAKGAARGGG